YVHLSSHSLRCSRPPPSASCPVPPPAPPSFPTRRSSDLARDEHRLAVASFRQQLIEWQGQVTEMKGLLAQGETRLGMRHLPLPLDRKSTRLNSSHEWISYAVFCLKKKKHTTSYPLVTQLA